MVQQNDKKESLGVVAGGADYFILLKPRVMSLVVFTAVVGMAVAPGHIAFWRGIISILSIALGGGAAGALNMWYDADIDSIMQRTKSRPIPTGKISKEKVLYFGLAIAIFSVFLLALVANIFSACFLAFTIFFYIIIYTILLKRRTPQNIVIGGASGAFPPMIGYACVTSSITIQSFILFLLIFLWTPPHFWSLSLFAKTDYEAANIPMFPNVHGIKSTKVQIFIYAILMSIAALLPIYYYCYYYFYAVIAIIFSGIFMYQAYDLLRENSIELTKVKSKKLFFFSLFYLAALFTGLLLEAIIHNFFGYNV